MSLTVKEICLYAVTLKTAALCLCLMFIVLSPARGFEKTETDFFTFYYVPEDGKAGAFLSSASDQIARDRSESLGLALLKKIDVFLVPAFDDFKKVHPDAGHIPTWAVGVAYPSKSIIVILRKNHVDLIKTFSHELNHILLGQAFNGRENVPRWLDEGLAMIQADEWSLSRLSTMTSAVLTGSLIPMDRLAESFPAEQWNAELAYCQSFYFISFLKGRFGEGSFKTFIQEYSKYKDFQNSIKRTYHISWDQMEKLWLDYLKLRFSWIPLITSTSTLWFVATIIFLIAYVRKKRKSSHRLREWAAEEALGSNSDEKSPEQ